MPEIWRFPILMAISFCVIFAVIAVAAGRRPRANLASMAIVSAIVSIGGMLFAKYGANAGFPWYIYYTAPAALTILLPPIYFAMGAARSVFYILLAFLSAPAIHFAALYLLGWDEYMPFLSALTP